MYRLVVTYKTGLTETTEHASAGDARRALAGLDNVDRWAIIAQDGSTLEEG